MKKKLLAIPLATLVLASGMSLAACGNNDVPDGFTAVTYNCAGLTTSTSKIFKEMVDNYNATQGQEDKVYVYGIWNTGTYNQYNTDLKLDTTKYSVATISEDQIRTLATSTAPGKLENLDAFMTDGMKETLKSIPDGLVNSFRVNSQTGTDGKYLVGEGANLLAVPVGQTPNVLYYNTKIFKNWGINIISVAEDKLDAYNMAHGSNLVAHGYAEYKENPVPDASPALTRSKNERGEQVYKVFNNRIAMSWEEQRLLSRFFKNGNADYTGYEYGYMSEWWYNYCWSVGGDCIRWDDTQSSYEFSITDKFANYLATETVTVNGTTYKQGDILHNEDSGYLAKNSAEYDEVASKLQELPSTYDAFLEFNRLGVPSNAQVETGVYGYGVAPNTTKERTKRFMTGNNCPLLVEDYSQGVESFARAAIKNDWDMAPTCQYRKYANDGIYYKSGTDFNNQYLMVIGEKYDLNGDGTVGNDEVYDGKLLTTSNGTPIKGKVTTDANITALAIPTAAPEGTKEAAMKFIMWVACSEGQKYIGKTNTIVPANSEYALSDEFNNETTRSFNAYAGSLLGQNTYVGDFYYFQSRTWIDAWADVLNGDVRKGSTTIQQFIDGQLSDANKALQGMNLRIKGR